MTRKEDHPKYNDPKWKPHIDKLEKEYENYPGEDQPPEDIVDPYSLRMLAKIEEQEAGYEGLSLEQGDQYYRRPLAHQVYPTISGDSHPGGGNQDAMSYSGGHSIPGTGKYHTKRYGDQGDNNLSTYSTTSGGDQESDIESVDQQLGKGSSQRRGKIRQSDIESVDQQLGKGSSQRRGKIRLIDSNPTFAEQLAELCETTNAYTPDRHDGKRTLMQQHGIQSESTVNKSIEYLVRKGRITKDQAGINKRPKRKKIG